MLSKNVFSYCFLCNFFLHSVTLTQSSIVECHNDEVPAVTLIKPLNMTHLNINTATAGKNYLNSGDEEDV